MKKKKKNQIFKMLTKKETQTTVTLILQDMRLVLHGKAPDTGKSSISHSKTYYTTIRPTAINFILSNCFITVFQNNVHRYWL